MLHFSKDEAKPITACIQQPGILHRAVSFNGVNRSSHNTKRERSHHKTRAFSTQSRQLLFGSVEASRDIQQTHSNLSTANKTALHSIMFLSCTFKTLLAQRLPH
jgi:hypothetical protein